MPKSKSKYYKHSNKNKGIEKRTLNNVRDGDEIHSEYIFDSELEARYYTEVIEHMFEQGSLKEVKIQPEYKLFDGFTKNGKKYQKMVYTADFELTFKDGQKLSIDVKGNYGKNVVDPTAVMRRKLFDMLYPALTLNWVTYDKKKKAWVSWDDWCKEKAKEKKMK